MKIIPLLAAATLTISARADFGLDLSAYTIGEVVSQKGLTGGVWSETPSATVSGQIGGVNAIGLDVEETGSLKFQLDSAVPSAKTKCDFALAFDELGDLEALTNKDGSFQFTLVRGDDGRASFAVGAGGEWRKVAHSEITPERATLYHLRTETIDMGGEKYVSLSVQAPQGFVRLEDEYGAVWFALRTDKTGFGEIEFSGNGGLGGFVGGDSGADPIPVRVWTGGASGDWTKAENWEGGTPYAGEVVRVSGKVELTGNGEAKVEDLVVRLGEEGRLEMLAGRFETPIEFEVTRPRAGKPLSVVVGSFGGLSRPLDAVAWYRGTPQKIYAAKPVGDTSAYQPTADDYEHWFRVVGSRRGATVLDREFFFSPLPVLYLTTKNGLTPSPEKEKHGGTLFVQGNDEFKSTYDGKMEIKVRGNTTSSLPKKPWKLKLDKKAELCGIAKSKHWVLLANYLDESSMRNKLAYDFANEIGSLGMKSDWVECVLNGEWQGLYQLCEHIRIDKNRVNIFNWEDEAEERGIDGGDEDFSWVGEDEDISGGYIFESSDEYDERSKFKIYSGNLLLPVMVNAPEYLYTNTRMMEWCQDFMQGFSDATTSFDGYSKTGLHYSQYADIDSMAAYFLVMEMFGNFDAEKKSRYFYKDRGALMKFGPVWDFDWGVGNYMIGDDPKCWRAQNHVESFFREWADDPWFCTRLKTLYWSVARAKFVKLLGENGKIAVYRRKLASAGAANETKWRLNHGFEEDVAKMENYLEKHLEWMDKKFADVPTLMASFKAASSNNPSSAPYEPNSTILPIAFANLTTKKQLRPQEPLELEVRVGGNPAAVGIYVNGLKFGEPQAVVGGRLAVSIPAKRLNVANGSENCIALVAFDSAGGVLARNYALVTVAPPFVLQLK